MKISISILTWNNLDDTKMLINTVLSEISALENEGFEFYLNIVDNGSKKDLVEFLESIEYKNYFLHKNKVNFGISRAKNVLIDKAIEQKSEYMFMFDNDLVPIKGSFERMIDYMEQNNDVGCFGQEIIYYKKKLDDPDICKKFPDLNKLSIRKNVESEIGAIKAWTHYSIFRTELLDKFKIRFEIYGPFGGSGYGFDDDDIGMQIYNNGFSIDCFTWVYCYHNISSSLKTLDNEKKTKYEERKKYICNKWRLRK